MRMPGFNADSGLSGVRALAAEGGGDDGGGGTITIEGNCFCAEYRPVCLNLGLCLPIVGCYNIEFCIDVCTRIRCIPA